MRRRVQALIAGLITAFIAGGPVAASPLDPSLLGAMRWRQIGPFRAGRISAVAGVIGQPGTYYIGSPSGGLWKSTDAGAVWRPIFDQTHSASIGALAVAPSNPDIVYAGTGDFGAAGTAFGAVYQGDGLWRSDDAGSTWRNVGLADTAHIGKILVDPKNPDIVLVAALGETYTPDPHRGIYLTEDGGKTWNKTLYRDDITGAIDLVFDESEPGVIYGSLWHHHVPAPPEPPENDVGGGAIYKSTDGGRTWTPLSGHGLPPWPMGRIGLTAAGGRVLAVISNGDWHKPGGLFRSDDGGANWRRISEDPRLVPGGRYGYFGKVWMDPQNRDLVYVARTSFYRSTDGGKTFTAYKGSPGGDDYHDFWMDPKSPCLPIEGSSGCQSSQMILGADQGASVSLNAGQTWSTWYNQPTAQIYYVATDNDFPYTIYGTQQDSGSVEVRSRGPFGNIRFMDWRTSMGAYEYGYVVPDPVHKQWLFASGDDGRIHRRTRETWEILDVSPYLGEGGPYRYTFGPYWGALTPPFVFSPQNGNILYLGAQFVLQSSDAGLHWRRISPDLTVRPDEPLRQVPWGEPTRNWGAISTLAPSPVNAGVIWAGTDDGIVQVTRDGAKSWRKASIAAMKPLDTVSMIEPSPFSTAAAYAVMDRHEWGDFKPYIYRTDDYGKTWTEITKGIADGSFVRVVRADPKRQGLLYAGTENGVYVSFNNGGDWQPLQLNLPTVAVRDLALRNGDLVAATFGRAFWILDDLSPLEQLDPQAAEARDQLFRPKTANRLRRAVTSDTPMPPEEPAGTNPPAGAALDYTLKGKPEGTIKLTIYDSQGKSVREFSSAPLPESEIRPVKWPGFAEYWMADPHPLTTDPGLNRFMWDLRYAPPASLHQDYPMSAVPHETPADPLGALVVPGQYTVKLEVDGHVYSQPLTVRRDPRMTMTAAAFAEQLALEQKLVAGMKASYDGYEAAKKQNQESVAKELSKANSELGSLTVLIDQVDEAPTEAVKSAAQRALAELAKQLHTPK